jgi:hypothetical protein
MTLNLYPPDLCLWSSWDYRHEPSVPNSIATFLEKKFLKLNFRGPIYDRSKSFGFFLKTTYLVKRV